MVYAYLSTFPLQLFNKNKAQKTHLMNLLGQGDTNISEQQDFSELNLK